MPFAQLPELVALDGGADGIRIPPDVTVPITPRVRSLIDTASLRRLTRVSQLGLVAAVYPGATHSRFEHSLGVYRLALEFLSRLRHEPRFAATIDEQDAAAFVVAALVHDIGHWAFCHPLEDMGLPELPRHESLVRPLLTAGELATIIETEWGISPARVASLVAGTAADPAGRLLCSLLSGPIDVDKMDYLSRDSLHAGVPYGRHFDQERLLSSLCLDESGETLAITEKGRTAAELMVFARYVMFSEVYWHHAVRAATAMLQRSIWLVRDSIEPARLTRFDDREFGDWLVSAARSSGVARLVDGLFGPARRLVKRAGAFDALHHPQVHQALAGRSYADSVAISRGLAERLSRRLGTVIDADTLLIDAPPAEREVEFRLAVRERTGARSASSRYRWRSLAELSPVVRSLAHEQFDNLVKRVRLFAPAESAAAIAECNGVDELILEAAAS
jgi:HD superfamily phosphohydrolase